MIEIIRNSIGYLLLFGITILGVTGLGIIIIWSLFLGFTAFKDFCLCVFLIFLITIIISVNYFLVKNIILTDNGRKYL